MPDLALPSALVRDSFLAAERALCAEEGMSADWLDDAARDFGAFVVARSALRRMWDVPVTELWYVDGDRYIGTVMVRHELTPALRHDGGNIGYHIVPGERRRGHATAMLGAACEWCRDRGMTQILLTCSVDNIGSQRVIEASAGKLEDDSAGVLRYWISL